MIQLLPTSAISTITYMGLRLESVHTENGMAKHLHVNVSKNNSTS